MSYRDWKVGDKVVCVDDAPSRTRYGLSLGLKKGGVYTIREIGFLVNNFEIGLRLEELKFPVWWDDIEGAVAPARFRPVQPRKTDISCFEALLHTNKQKEPAQ